MTKRPFNSTDLISSYYEAKQNLESANKRQRIFTNPTSKSKLLRQDIYAFIERHNSGIDTQIDDQVNVLINILKQVIRDNNVNKLQELISHGILDELNNNNNNVLLITEIVGSILKFNRNECLLLISPFIECKHFNINKFKSPILFDPFECILFLHSNNWINLRSSYCKLFHKCIEYGHIKTVQYCLINNVPVDSCENRGIRDAARYGKLDIVKLLHKFGANIHQYEDEALRKAARHGNIDIVKYLIKHGANIHQRNSESLTWSVINGHFNCVNYIIQNCNLKKYENINIIQYSIKYKQYKCLALLIKYGYTLFNKELRELFTNNNNNNNIYNNNDDNNDIIITNIDRSLSPISPMSPTYSLSPSPIGNIWINNSNNQEENEKQRLFDAISEGLALREAIFVSILTEFVYEEIAYIIMLYEKLACTEEDIKIMQNNTKSKNKYKSP